MLKRLLFVLLVLIVIATGSGIAAYQHLRDWWVEPRALTETTIVTLARGQDLRSFALELEKTHLIDSAPRFLVWTRLTQDYRRFQAGTYRFEGAIAPIQIASAIVSGEVYRPVVFELKVPEGFTLQKIAPQLVQAGLGTYGEILALRNDVELVNLIRSNLPARESVAVKSVEGFLFPATYPFEVLPTPREVLRKMILTFFEKLPADYAEVSASLGTSVYNAVVVASLIEVETKVADERPMVAEVIWSRLKRGITLGIDAAIIYGIPDYAGDITFAHLRDSKNPYNLRIHGGLPPTPISSPGLDSLKAALTPTANGFLYYVLDPAQAPRHYFSKTMQEHSAAVARLRRAGR